MNAKTIRRKPPSRTRRSAPLAAAGRRCHGFTLTEVLVGLTVAALSLTGAFGLSTASLRAVRSAREQSRAMEAVNLELERLRTMPWDVLTQYDVEQFYVVNAADNPVLADLTNGAGYVAVTDPWYNSLGATPSRSRLVYALVVWTGSDGRSETALTMSIVAKHNHLRTQ